MDPGRGAYVLSGGWSGGATGAAPYLVDAKGRADPLGGADAASLWGTPTSRRRWSPTAGSSSSAAGSRCRRTPRSSRPASQKGSACG